ncbi:MAG: polymer-forming cytoskeletal protein [Bdellovibrionales bacterium]|nr:polymer-forming cytoskeletal protein [Bdellovibrionales bacterium]
MNYKLQDFAAPEAVSTELTGVLEPAVEFEGTLAFHGCFHVNGSVKGKVVTPDMLIVGESGRIQGDIKAGVVIIFGKVEATIEAKHRVEIRKPAVFRGEMSTPSLKVEDGVIFEGTNKML